jgi:hypothetical protein
MDLEDMSLLRTQVIGRIEATVYLVRILETVPYGRSSRLRHVVSGSNGFECSLPRSPRGL